MGASEFGNGIGTREAARNAELMARQVFRRRGIATPEFFITKRFDNSRLVKAPDPGRVHEMRIFSAAVAVLFSLIMVYGLQHFSAIEMGYRVEAEKQQLEQLREENRQLRLTEAQLTEPERIDQLARTMGMSAPQPGQVIQPGAIDGAASAPSLAQMQQPAAGSNAETTHP